MNTHLATGPRRWSRARQSYAVSWWRCGCELGGRAVRPLQAADGSPAVSWVIRGLDAGDDFRLLPVGGRPQPARRTGSTSTSRSTSWRRPAATVDGSMPSRAAMRRWPPHPHLSDSRPATAAAAARRAGCDQHDGGRATPPASRSASGSGRTRPGVAMSSRRARSWWVCLRGVGRTVEETGRRACAASASRRRRACAGRPGCPTWSRLSNSSTKCPASACWISGVLARSYRAPAGRPGRRTRGRGRR